MHTGYGARLEMDGKEIQLMPSPQSVRLFVIRQRGRKLYWSCSTEHSCGWTDGHPKQSFSPSELTKQIRLLIDEGWFADIEILELCVRG